MTDTRLQDIQAVVIGASTGGPNALVYIISKISEDFNLPIFIVQHMPKGFTTSFAARLDNESKLTVVEAKDNLRIEKGVVYLAPGDFHMTIGKNKIRLNSDERIFGVRPSVDYLFKSASNFYGENLLGIILTGMGRDGTDGMLTIKNNGGFNIAQNKESCVVYGMPGNAVANGVVNQIMTLDEIVQTLNSL